MSLRSRARNVQRAANLSYQQAVQALRALGDEPARLAERYGWSLSRADLYLVDKSLDAEHREVARFGALVVISRCAECKRGFFLAIGSGETTCPVHRGSDQEQTLRRGCEEVRARCDARSVAVVLREGQELAWAGERDAMVRTAVRQAMRELAWTEGGGARARDLEEARPDLVRILLWGRDRAEAPPGYTLIEMRGGTPSSLLLVLVGAVAAVALHFDGRTSLAAVAVTLHPLLDLLEKRRVETPPSLGWPPGGGGQGPSGAGAYAWEVRPFLAVPGKAEEVEPLDLPRRRSRPS